MWCNRDLRGHDQGGGNSKGWGLFQICHFDNLYIDRNTWWWLEWMFIMTQARKNDLLWALSQVSTGNRSETFCVCLCWSFGWYHLKSFYKSGIVNNYKKLLVPPDFIMGKSNKWICHGTACWPNGTPESLSKCLMRRSSTAWECVCSPPCGSTTRW